MMLENFPRKGLIVFYLLIIEGVFTITLGNIIYSEFTPACQNISSVDNSAKKNSATTELENLNIQLYKYVTLGIGNRLGKDDQKKIDELIDDIKNRIYYPDIDRLTISDSYYFLGIYKLLVEDFQEALNYLLKSASVREEINIRDTRLGRTLYNIGIAYKRLGDFYKMEEYDLKALELFKKHYGDNSPELIDLYSSLISVNIELQKNEDAISFSNAAIRIAENKPDSIHPESLVGLYTNLGVAYTRVNDYSNSRLYLEKSESIQNKNHLNTGVNYINLINSLAITYSVLGLSEKSNEYYEKGVSLALAMSGNSSYSYNIVNSYAITLGNNGNSQKGEDLLKIILKKAASDSLKRNQTYFEVLANYADYLREYNIDNNKSLDCYSECLGYLQRNPNDLLLRSRIYMGYSLSLTMAGESQKALEVIQQFINLNYRTDNKSGTYGNPEINILKPDKTTIRLFRAKHQILWSIYRKTNNFDLLKTASETSELIVSLLEEMRINISEEDSRLILGDRYRDSYFAAIRDFNLLFSTTSDPVYNQKAFEFSEKGKVAGLLASTRELNAIQFRIPPDIAAYEARLKYEINSIYASLDEESIKESPNSDFINTMNEKLLKNIRLRDSLILVFENKYPEYYSLKYNTKVASLEDIPSIIGRNRNYINYLLSDSVLNVFVVNRKFRQQFSFSVDSDFFDKIRQFRNLLEMPSSTGDAMAGFIRYQNIGLELYNVLIKPLRPYLISDELIISPDNIISYIPFETLPASECNETKPDYRSIPYLMNEFDISYTYSATLMAEYRKRGDRFGNKVLAFAPNYPESIDIESVFLSRQFQNGVLRDLPFARQEAQYVTKITGGDLFENADAKESTFKNISGEYDIIHLAMHTLLNDKDPMRSTMIFSSESDTIEDHYLKTYEVYGIPLKAKMVVLSSCNTGNGFLSSGEGILSLARGFTYSGAQSVVMSMWEIEDRSGTEIVKMFYSNLKKGYSKSSALRKARITYLNNSDLLRAHPYFWSSLIIYGNNDRLYYTRYLIYISSVLIGIFLISLLIYFSGVNNPDIQDLP